MTKTTPPFKNKEMMINATNKTIPSFKTKDYKYKETITKIINILRKNDNDDTANLELYSYPKKCKVDYKKYLLKKRRIQLSESLDRVLNELYDSNYRILEMSKSSSTTNVQVKYTFTKQFKDILIKGLEVNCRMITSDSFSSSSNTTSYKLSRIGNITFKGRFKDIFDKLMTKCKEEIAYKYANDNQSLSIRSAAMYVPDHNDVSCYWPCQNIEDFMKNDSKNFFNSESINDYSGGGGGGGFGGGFSSSIERITCFSNRQIIGQEILPFIYDEEDDDDDDDNDNDDDDDDDEDDEKDDIIPNKQNNFLFDNLFFKANDDELLGIKREYINYKPNFLSVVDTDDCTALISFTLHSIGQSSSGLNLYLKPIKNCPIYCTNIESVKKLPNAKSYLEELVYKSRNVQDEDISKYLKKSFDNGQQKRKLNKNDEANNKKKRKCNNVKEEEKEEPIDEEDEEEKEKEKPTEEEEEEKEEEEEEEEEKEEEECGDKVNTYKEEINRLVNDDID